MPRPPFCCSAGTLPDCHRADRFSQLIIHNNVPIIEIFRNEDPDPRGRRIDAPFRNLGRSRRKTCLACCGDQRWKETRRFPDRQVTGEGTEKAKGEALSFVSIMAWAFLFAKVKNSKVWA